jgi:hypothetical protein
MNLTRAWKAVEAALPDGWEVYDLTRYAYDSDCGEQVRNDVWQASAGLWSVRYGEQRYFPDADGADSTPEGALQALAANLRRINREAS